MVQLKIKDVETNSTGDLPKRLWTQLRHLSHMDCKNRSQIDVGNAAAGGTGSFDGMGGRRIIHPVYRCAYIP
jgi:hypothetical protein